MGSDFEAISIGCDGCDRCDRENDPTEIGCDPATGNEISNDCDVGFVVDSNSDRFQNLQMWNIV